MSILTVSIETPVLQPCPIAAELDYLANAARRLVSIGDSPRRSVASVRAVVAVARKRHRHAAGCTACLVREALSGSVLQ
jgi:hypothetical protein